MSTLTPVHPRYGGQSLVNLTASVLHHFGLDPPQPVLACPLDLQGARRLVVVVCDALGADALQGHLASGALPHLAAWLRRGDAWQRRLTSVFPSTTVAALASLHTGVPPCAHGDLGFGVWLGPGPEVTDLLASCDRYSRTPRSVAAGPVEAVYRRLSAAGVRCRIVNAAAFWGSRLSRWHFAGAEYVAHQSPATLPTLVADALAGPGPALVWTYWPQHDPVCHQHGPHSAAAADELAALDLALERLTSRLPADGHTALLLTGDHGQRDLRPEQAVALEKLGLGPPAGDRVAAYVRGGDEVGKRLAAWAEVHPMEEIWRDGWFGGAAAHPCFHRRTGDLLAITHPGVQFLFGARPGDPPVPWRGGHGGWSPQEMWVPLVGWRR